MRGNSYQGNVKLPQAANDPGQPPAPRRRTIPAPINDNRQPFWQRRLVRLITLISVIGGGIAWYFYQVPTA
jgi:hypothetical protein